jgi:hypothetical protein
MTLAQITKLPWRVADWPPIWRERFEERAGIIQFMSLELKPSKTPEATAALRKLAEQQAEKDIRWQFTQESAPPQMQFGIIADTLGAMLAAKEHAKAQGFKQGNGGTGEMPCPTNCGGTLRYSVANVNGHMHAVCSTKDCVRWME